MHEEKFTEAFKYMGKIIAREFVNELKQQNCIDQINLAYNTSQQSTISKRKLFTLNEWAKKHKEPPMGGLRHLVFHAEKNGFHKVIRRIGKRIYLDEEAFFKWVDENRT